jgi:hypothetical protein
MHEGVEKSSTQTNKGAWRWWRTWMKKSKNEWNFFLTMISRILYCVTHKNVSMLQLCWSIEMTNWSSTEESVSVLGFACKNKVQFFQVREYYNKSQESLLLACIQKINCYYSNYKTVSGSFSSQACLLLQTDIVCSFSKNRSRQILLIRKSC